MSSVQEVVHISGHCQVLKWIKTNEFGCIKVLKLLLKTIACGYTCTTDVDQTWYVAWNANIIHDYILVVV
jgi:hypothetical protein